MATKDEEDYGDYVTRCICGLTHDDGYMIACDGCSVWQHVECMQVNPNNLPDKYLCEICGPRPVDRRRARQLQLKKREDMSDDDGSPDEGRVRVSSHLPPSGTTSSVLAVKKKKKRGSKSGESIKPEVVGKRPKREKGCEGPPKKTRRKSQQLPRVQHMGQAAGRGGSIQSLLTAASLLEEQPWTDVWNSNSSPWTDKYDLAERNRYTETVRSLLASRLTQLKSEAVVYSQEEYCTQESRMPHPQCSLGEVQLKRKGVVADMGIGGDEIVIEYKGKVTVKQAVLNDLAMGKSLWKHKPCPFVYLYDKISDFDLCIDARNDGNIARFIRRSCTPNAELRHFFVANELCFGVYATDDITTGEEVTLPFDFRYEKCDYPVECACGQKSTCLVVRSNRSKKRQSGGGGGTKSVEEGESRQSRGSSRTRSQLLAHDEDSNSSWVSTGSGRKKPRHIAGPFSPRQSSRQTSREMSSDSEEETTEKKVKSREERKTEAVWKMFEKMEASQRRRQQLYSEGSIDSDTMSPSTAHPPSLLAHKQLKERHPSTSSRKAQLHASSGGKVRLSSVSSADPLSPTEFSEAFSPPLTPRPSVHPPTVPYATPSVPASPLTSPPSSATKAPFLITPHLHPKYLFARFALPWKKAILKQWEEEQRQWEDTAPLHLWPSNGHIDPVCGLHVMRGGERRNRARGSLKHRWLKQHSEEVANGLVEEEREGSGAASTGIGSDKENRGEQPRRAPLPHKKQVLLRWKESKGESAFPVTLDAHQSPLSLSEHTTKDFHVPSDAPRTPTSPDVPALNSRCTFPLFDEFSSDDEEFELPRRERETKPQDAGGNDGHGETEEDVVEGPHTPPGGPRTPPLTGELDEEMNDEVASNLSAISDTSLHSDTPMVNRNVTKGTHPETDESLAPPPPAPPLPVVDTQASMGASDISGSSEGIDVGAESKDLKVPPKEEEKLSELDDSGATKPRHPGEAWSKAQSEESSEEVEMEVSSPASVSNEQGGIEEEESVARWVQGEVPREPTMEAEQKGSIQEAQPVESEREKIQEALKTYPGTPREYQLVREQSSGSCSPDPRVLPAPPTPGTTSGTARTPGKRKINLSEYRNRARKPAEQRKSSAVSSPPHVSSSAATTTSSTPAFLSHVITPSMLTSPSPLHTSTFVHASFTHSHTFTTPSGLLEPGVKGVPPPVPPPPAGAPAAPQFEPVSPDDGDNTPPMVIMEGSNPGHQGQLHAVPASITTMLVPNLPGYPPSTVAIHGGILPAEHLMVGQVPVSYMQQAHPPATGQYIVDVRWSGGTPVEHAHDPRRGAIQGSGEMYAQQPVHMHTQDQMAGHHGGLLPLPGTPTGPPPMVIQHPGSALQLPLHAQPGPGDIQPHPQGLIHHAPGEYCPPPHPPVPGPRPGIGFVPHHHRQVYRHPDSGGNYYGH